MSRVFISYVAEDSTLAVRLAQGLEAAGYATWYYERDSLPGPSYLGQILHALGQVTAILVLVSPAALASWQVEKEVVQAHERGLPFVPLLHGLGYEMLRAQKPEWALAFGAAVALPLPSGDVASVLPQIVAGLRWLAGDRPTPAPLLATDEPAAAARGPAVDALPVPPTPLLGRDQAVAQLAALLQQPAVRLVTLTGPGGVGKTRLALAVAEAARAAFADGVCFVDLAPLTEVALVVSTIAQALGVTEGSGQPLAETLRAALRERALLLVLDNVEQVVAAAPTVADLLAACPRLLVLATSRVPLHLRGERDIAVPPLAVPDLAHLPRLDALAQIPAVALFVARAQEASAAFALSEATAAAVATICRRLDGLPLAIELAAARVKLLPPPALLARLSNRLTVLVGGARDLPERQRTLRATIDWSYDLLQSEEQALLAHLSVFQGGRSLEAIEAVCNSDGDLDVLAGLEALLANNLLGQTEADGEPRFVLLETLHEYARERLEERGETAALRRAHAQYYLALAETAAPQLVGPQQATWLDRLEREHDNLRAALRWAVDSRQGPGGQPATARSLEQAAPEAREVGLRLGGALGRFWKLRGHLSEGRHWLEALLAASEAAPAALRATALSAAGALAYGQGDYGPATAMLEEALALHRALGDDEGSAQALHMLGNVASDQGDYARARALYEEALPLKRALGDQHGVAKTLINVGIVAHEQGDFERAAAQYVEGLALFRAAGDTQGIAQALGNLGTVAYDQEDYGRASALYEESLALFRELGDLHSIALSLICLGNVAHDHGDDGRAAARHAEALALCRTMGNKWLAAYGLDGLAGAVGAQGQAEQAARLFGAAEATRQLIGAPLSPREQPRHDRQVAAACASLDQEMCAAAWAAGAALSWEQAIAEVLHE